MEPEATDIYEYAKAILDTAHDIEDLLPVSPYSMSKEQMRISTYKRQIVLGALGIRAVIRQEARKQ